MSAPATFHEALHSLIQMGPGSQCEECGHFADRHYERMCRFPRPENDPCKCKSMKWRGQRLRMGPLGPLNDPSFTCPVCDMTSHNPNDVEWGYCGNCHGYTGTVDAMMKAKRMISEAGR